MERRPPAMEGSCEYNESAAEKNDKGVGRGINNPLTIRNKTVMYSLQAPRTRTDSLDKRPKRRRA
jgi:hypothetical protein